MVPVLFYERTRTSSGSKVQEHWLNKENWNLKRSNCFNISKASNLKVLVIHQMFLIVLNNEFEYWNLYHKTLLLETYKYQRLQYFILGQIQYVASHFAEDWNLEYVVDHVEHELEQHVVVKRSSSFQPCLKRLDHWDYT